MLAVVCPHCRQPMHVRPEHAHLRVRCPSCNEILTPTPVAGTAAAETDAADSRPAAPTAGVSAAPFTVPSRPAHYPFLAAPQQSGDLGALGPYRVVRLLGKGGMAYVFEAIDPLLGRRVALKVMRPEAAAQPTGRARFLREARAVAGLQHPHIITVFRVDQDHQPPFLVMPLLSGESLEAYLRRGQRPPLAESLRIGREIAEGLAAAHAAGIIHRDIKPANVWLEAPRGHVKLLDFGLAREQASMEGLTRASAALGTPGYMAPEQFGGQVDERTDLFALGCVLYEMVTGRRPFAADSVLGMMVNLAQKTPEPPSALDADVPEAVSALVLQLLAKSPQGRPASAAEVARRLQCLETTSAAPNPPQQASGLTPRRRLGGRARVLLLILLLVLLLVAAAFVLLLASAVLGAASRAGPPLDRGVDGQERLASGAGFVDNTSGTRRRW